MGILDLYGYENPDQVPGGFEQLVINFANEKLQQVITDWTLGAEQEEYVSEAIEWTHIDYPNNRYDIEKCSKALCYLNQACRFAFCEKTQAAKNSRKCKLKQIFAKNSSKW